jgi:hypothetical protein
MIYQEAHIVEQRCLLDSPFALGDELFVNMLIAYRRNNVPVELLLKRGKYLAQLYELPWLSEETYRMWDKQQSYHIQEFDSPTRKPKKYSGYVRNSSAVGSKRGRPRIELIPSFNVEEYDRDIDFLEFLTVGELMGRSVSFQHPDDGLKKVRNGNNRVK